MVQVGPVHTSGDTLIHVPDALLLYAGDIVFIGGALIVWAGPIDRWIAAYDLLLDLDLEAIVPGLGPVTDNYACDSRRASAAARIAASGFTVGANAYDPHCGRQQTTTTRLLAVVG